MGQQTLRRSFVIAGVGLHTADYSYIRIRPAYAGEGRYFVIVPRGTISYSKAYVTESKRLENDKSKNQEDNIKRSWDAIARTHSSSSSLNYNEAKTKGYEGSVEMFEEEFFAEGNQELLKEIIRRIDESSLPEDFEVIPQSSVEAFVPATLKFARPEIYYTALERNGYTINSVEHLLAALEACGVDNCRIELEGGREIPVIDGSAHGWTTLISRAGVTICDKEMPKKSFKVRKPITLIGKNDCFVCVMPSDTTLITCGWDAVSKGAPCLGSSWYTWHVDQDFHFHYSIAPAKTFFHSEFELDALYSYGLIQSGPTHCAIVGMGETFQDAGEVTFPDDEAARHKIIDFTGDLALLSTNGNDGLPIGHYVAWNADHVLQINFCIQVFNELIKPNDKPLESKTPRLIVNPIFKSLPKEDYSENQKKIDPQIDEKKDIEELATQAKLSPKTNSNITELGED